MHDSHKISHPSVHLKTQSQQSGIPRVPEDNSRKLEGNRRRNFYFCFAAAGTFIFALQQKARLTDQSPLERRDVYPTSMPMRVLT